MTVCETALPGVLLFVPARHRDARGAFEETWHRARYAEAGVPERFVQDNVSFSEAGVLRGLHFQHPAGQGKLLTVLQGAVWDVAVDVRRASPTFGRWVGMTLSRVNGRQLYVPEGFAHGFVVTGEGALVHYKCTAYYAPEHEHSVRWDDPDLSIEWPVRAPVLSEKDQAAPRLRDLPPEALPAR